jgi:hypothetical protein
MNEFFLHKFEIPDENGNTHLINMSGSHEIISEVEEFVIHNNLQSTGMYGVGSPVNSFGIRIYLRGDRELVLAKLRWG